MSSSLGRRTCQFSLDEIKSATNNFDKAKLLGVGGEGEVYKGLIHQVNDDYTRADVTVAIKCLTSKSREHKFDEEIKLVSSLHHANLVSLRGYCQATDHKILVYDYVHNGNLAQNLYPTCLLSWTQLLNICIGAARGLHYLHHGTSEKHKIIHRDVKPSNILLDENWGAKLSDFGLSKRGLSNYDQESDAIKTDLKGTFGYYAPEYVFNKEVSRKTDVYAFGVVLLEVLCRKRRGWPLYDESSSDSNKQQEEVKEEEDIREWARKNIATDLKHQISEKCLKTFIEIARRCLFKNPKLRPGMTDVMSKLQKALQLQKNSEPAAKSRTSFGKAGLPPLPKLDSQATRKASKVSVEEYLFGSSIEDSDPVTNNSEAATKSRSSFGKTGFPPLPKPKSQTNKKSLKVSYDHSSGRSSTKVANLMANSGAPTSKSVDKPSKKDRAVLYLSSYNSTSRNIEKSVEDSLIVRVILKEVLRVDFDERHLSKHEAYRLKHDQKADNDLCLPQLFVGGQFVGVDMFIQLYLEENLASLLGGSPITHICDYCGDAMTCKICVWSSKFAVCKACDTLTMVRREEKEQLRCCTNCQINDQLFLRTLILNTEGDVYLEGISLSCDEHFEEDFGVRWETDTFQEVVPVSRVHHRFETDTFQEVIPVSRVHHHFELAFSLIMLILALYFLNYRLQSESRDPSIQPKSSVSWLQALIDMHDSWGTVLDPLVLFFEVLEVLERLCS